MPKRSDAKREAAAQAVEPKLAIPDPECVPIRFATYRGARHDRPAMTQKRA
jgi:hypothetical protein